MLEVGLSFVVCFLFGVEVFFVFWWFFFPSVGKNPKNLTTFLPLEDN